MAHGLVKLRNMQSFIFLYKTKNIVSHIIIYLQMCILRLVNVFGHCDMRFEVWKASPSMPFPKTYSNSI